MNQSKVEIIKKYANIVTVLANHMKIYHSMKYIIIIIV